MNQSSRSNSSNNRNSRKRLILATISAIAENGLSKVTMSKITERAHFSNGIINFYFKSKQQLLLDTLKHLVQEYQQVKQQHLASANTPQEVLTAFIHASFDEKIFVKDKIAVWYAFWSEMNARRDYHQICDKYDQQEHELLLRCFQKLLDSEKHDALDTEVLVHGLNGLIDRLWQQALLHTKEVDREHSIELCLRYVHKLVPTLNQSEKRTNKKELVDLLPPWAYRNSELFELEIEQIFRPSWMLVGHVSDIPKVGDYLTFEGFNEMIVVIRSENGKVHAFHNICRHRGSKILNGEGNCPRALVCPFHGWRYNLEGKLQFIPKPEGFPHLNKDTISLVSVDIEIWQGFIFIRLVSGGESLQTQMKSIVSEIEDYRLEDVEPYCKVDRYTVPVNWKVFHDIDNEGYHVPIGHPSLNQLYGQDYTDNFIDGIPVSIGRFNQRNGSLWSVKNYRKLLPDFEHLREDHKNSWLYFGIFPNIIFGLYPEMMEIYMTIPKSLTETEIISRVYALPDQRPMIKALRYLNRRINKVTDLEDKAYTITIQEGLKSSVYPDWNLHRRAEVGVGEYHQAIQRQLPIAKLRNEPPAGSIRQLNQQMLESESTTLP